MNWYYVHGGEQTGPIDDAGIAALAQAGTIGPDTMVWREGMAQWQRYDTVTPPVPPPARTENTAGGSAICVECGTLVPLDEMVAYGDSWICAACKPVFFQRLKEGAALPRQLRYAGFWIRVGAYLIDGLILGAANMAIGAAMGGLAATPQPEPGVVMPGMMVLSWLVSLALGITYMTWFVGKFGATPGKMACGLKIVRGDGGAVTYGRAFGRYWALALSSLTFCIGFLMVAFDDEKRGLHDRLCDTRVVRK